MRPLKRRSHTSPRRDPAKTPAAAGGIAKPSRPLSRRRVWLFRLALLMVVPLVLLAGAELALRLARFGHSTSFFNRATINGEDFLVENPQFGLRFFPPELARSPAPVVMRAHKPAGLYRIFLLGESAALGDPAPAFGVGRYLETLLRERYPGSDFEVVCVAMTAINSHAILPIARECARQDGDLWVLYMGNNEMVGPFGAATVFGAKAPPGWLVRMKLALQQSRLMQALAGIRGNTRGRTWEGMKLFLENQITPEDPRRETVYRNFRANLEDILRTGERAGVPIVLSTVAVNVKDFAPFASWSGDATGTNLPPEVAKLASAAAAAQGAGDWSGAIRLYEKAAELTPRYAGIEFLLGQCQLALSNQAAARASFSRARDDDALPFRADSRINGIIEEAGRAHANRGVHLLDASITMAGHSPAGIPGDESFYEHVHFHFDGNYRLARALAGTIAGQLPGRITQGGTSEWATEQQCERDLGLTDWNRREVFDNVVRRLLQPPFTGRPENPARVSLWRGRLNAVRTQLTATNAAAARAVYLEALNGRTNDFRLHWNYAEFLEATGDLPRAAEEWRRVQSLIPHHHAGYFQLGRVLAEQGRRDEARRWLNQAVALRPDLGAGWLELGSLSLAEGGYEEALRHLARAKEFAPQEPWIPLQSAKALSGLKRSGEAIQQASAAVKLDPDFWEARSFLGEELAFAGRIQEARRQFEQVLRLKPDYPWAHLNLGVALFKAGQHEEAVRQFAETLRLDPENQQAKQYLEQLQSLPSVKP